MSKSCVHFVVTGRVQGVFYRSETKKQARKLNLTGWVKNLPTGQVEVLACGEQAQVEELSRWLWHGPRASLVKEVVNRAMAWQEHSGFVISY